MKTERSDRRRDPQSPHVASLAAASYSALDAWHPRPNGRVPATAMTLTEEEHYRLIELVQQRQARRNHLTPESFLWDWLDATAEIKPH